jgi:hypothetical protein
MILTTNQCNLLLSMFNASITNAMNSGIPIGREYYKDIDAIREKLYTELGEANGRGLLNDFN